MVLATLLLFLATAPVAALDVCPGDCGDDGRVSVDELVLGVNIALARSPLAACPAADANHDDAVSVDELVQSVGMALGGCPPRPTATPTIAPMVTASPAPSPSDTASATPEATGPSAVTGTPTATGTKTRTPQTTPGGPTPTPPSRPNFILINLDDTRADGIDRMPTVAARLMGEGLQFSQSFVPLSLCCPSRASIFCGLYAFHHGTRQLAGDIGGAHVFRETGVDHETIAVWLQKGGYETGLFGKYLNAYSGSEATAGPGGTFYVPPGWRRWRAMASSEHYGGILGPTYQLVDETGHVTVYDDHATDEQYSTDLLGRELRTFIADAVGAGKSFFAVYTPYASHADTPDFNPKPAARHLDAFADLPLWRPPSWDETDVTDKPRWIQALPLASPIAAAVSDQIRVRAYETLLAVDEQLGQVLDQLQDLGIDRDTVIFFTSDNGVTWGEHRFFGQGKECPYEECIRVPLIVRYPRGITTAPAVSAATVLNIDVPATIAELAGIEVPMPIDGVSLAGWFGGSPPFQWRTDFLLEHWNGNRNATINYVAHPTDGDRLRLQHGGPWPTPRESTVFEFDNGDGVSEGAIGVPLGVTADEAFSTLGDLVSVLVPFAVKQLDPAHDRLTIIDTSPDHASLYWLEEVDQGNAFEPVYPVPDFFGVRDVANQLTYVEHETGEVELYDLTSDPAQLQNVADDPSYESDRTRLAARMRELLAH